MTTTRVTQIDDLEEGTIVYNAVKQEVYRVGSCDVRRADDGRPTGTVSLTRIGNGTERVTQDAEDMDYALCEGDLLEVPQQIVHNPQKVLLEFAEQELTRYLNRLNHSHPFNGITGVEQVSDLCAAEAIYNREIETRGDA